MRSKDTIIRLQRFRYEEKRRQVLEIETMIGEFQRKQDDLDQQVKAEESRTGVPDPTHYNYSLTAKAIRARRDNLIKSIGDLREQLAEAKARFDEVASDLHKAELLAEKSGALSAASGSATAAPLSMRT